VATAAAIAQVVATAAVTVAAAADSGNSGGNSGGGGGKVQCRKDHNLHPINTDFDLYSMGPDGQSEAALTAKASRDDIIRASDGAFIGKASNY
jgi:hypothetical protein